MTQLTTSYPSRTATNPKRERVDMSSSYPSEKVNHCIQDADTVKHHLAEFITAQGDISKFISLGENCSSAWYLKQLGLRDAAYPFDWIFSSPDIVVDCIENQFRSYLDKGLIQPNRDQSSAGHKIYHEHLFNHRNPIATEDDYGYVYRCCERFNALKNSNETCCFLITLINEPAKRPMWAKGFTKDFAMPTSQSVDSLTRLFNTVKAHCAGAKFVVVDHYTNSSNSTQAKQISDDVFWIEFHAEGNSTGVFFENKLDDFCFKLSLTGLFGK